MSFNLKGRSYLKLDDFSQREMLYLLDLSRDLKRAKYSGTERELLKGKEICLIFEKTSTRTRCAFEVAAHDQGAHVTYLDPSGSQIGHKESMKDTARVLGRMFDYVVLDSMMSIAPLYASVLKEDTVNLVVMQLNVPSAKNSERFVGAMRRMGMSVVRSSQSAMMATSRSSGCASQGSLGVSSAGEAITRPASGLQ